MRALLLAAFFVFGTIGLLAITVSSTAIGEIEGMICLLIASILLVGAQILEAISNAVKQELQDREGLKK